MLVVYNNAVNLSCKYTYNLFSKEFRASLTREQIVLWKSFRSKTGFHCDGKLGNETVTFYLWNLFVNQTDIYFCKIEVMYPPPYIDNEKSNGTIIHVKENHHCPAHRTPESSKPFWALMKSKRNRVLQSDYLNMTPRRLGPTRRHYHPYAPSRDFAAYRS
ncbi:hypothetical protein QTO34_002603 [Cnephaeus nilssonii]|uniref:Immunoglobulin V-set domain-containing protein n=1 Tax=Cnephaeus nilssonii TaxID=3371016 RepID=A0AA40LKS1_CNENI|nr:hypothetical protein QTO34_002603 [Eptesicus nilssonii]